MKLILIFLITFSGGVFAQVVETNTGTKTLPGKTLGQQSYPNSGPTKRRSNDITGEDTSTSLDSSNTSPQVPSNTPEQRQEEKPFKVGPYNKEGQFQYFEKEE